MNKEPKEKRKIKVLHYGYSYNSGGIENIVLSWARRKNQCIQFDFINDTNRHLAFEEELKAYGCKVINIADRNNHPIKHIFDINTILKNDDYDFLHMHVMDIDEAIPIILANKTKKTKAIVHCHSNRYMGLNFKEKVLIMLTKIELIGARYLRVSCAKESGKKMFGNNHFSVINNGIDLKRFAFDEISRNEIRKKFNIRNSDIVIGHVGRPCIEKNYPFIFSTFSKLLKYNKNYKLLLIGDFIGDKCIDFLIEKNSIRDNVIISGVVNDTSKYYSAMDLFYMPSISEGLPIACMEAQASGLFAIVSNNVPDEVKVSDNIIFIELDEDIAIEELKKGIDKRIDRKKIKIDSKISIDETSRQLFDFYYHNL